MQCASVSSMWEAWIYVDYCDQVCGKGEEGRAVGWLNIAKVGNLVDEHLSRLPQHEVER